MSTDVLETAVRPVEALAGRLFGAGVEAMELCSVQLGVQLGLYAALAEGPGTVADLAPRTGVAPRYLLEWLRQQAIAGFVHVDGDEPGSARYALADGVADVL